MKASARSRAMALLLLSAAVILLQILVTRILSVVVWYHWAFFSISLCMLGLGAPAVWFAIRGWSPARLFGWLVGAAVAVPCGIVGIVKLSRYFGEDAILGCLLCLLPGVLYLGAAICQLLLEGSTADIGRRYGYDLLGACLGALLVIPLMTWFPTPALAAAVGALPVAAYVLLGGSRVVAAGLALGLSGLFAWGEPIRLRHGKIHDEIGRTAPIYERWTPTARLTIFDNVILNPNAHAAFAWGRGSKPIAQSPPPQYWLEQDGSAGTPITRFEGNYERLQFLFDDVTTIAHQLRPPRSVAVIGAGGGRDVLTALLAGAQQVDAIELNAGIVDALRGPFADFAGAVYDLPGVTAIVGEGRSVLTRRDRRYDLIQISLIDSWAATAAGAFALSENNLYTLEAYRLYWSRLSPQGMVSTSRWMEGSLRIEMPRLLLLVRAALEAEGVSDPGAHLALVQGGQVGTVLMSKAPFGASELDTLRRLVEQHGFVVHLPVSVATSAEPLFERILAAGPDHFRPFALVMDPPTDDRPFFFQTVSPLRPIPPETVRVAGVNARAVRTLRQLMLIMCGLAGLLFFAPFPLSRWFRPTPQQWRASAYFAAIGLAFMLVEVAWVQRFILFLGHPSLATTVALGSLLLGAGSGALFSSRLTLSTAQRAGFGLALAVAAGNYLLGPVFQLGLGLPWAGRVVVAIALLAPIGFLMGLGFPLGMRRFAASEKAWLWAVNGAASVVASVAALALSMELGFTQVANGGAILYVAAWLLLSGRLEPA